MTINDILKMNIPAEFGCDEDGETTDSIEKVFDQLDSSVNTAYGATKFIIFLNDKEVVKIPFNGCYWYDSCEDWRFDEFYVENYCAKEAEIYRSAEDAGLAEFFASTKFCGRTVNGKPIYVSERVYEFYDSGAIREKTDSFSENSMTKAKELKEAMYTRLHVEWVARAIEYYGFEAVQKLFKFINEENISDLHTSNVGFREDGSPVILDYSGYEEG